MSAQVEGFARRFGSAKPWWFSMTPELDTEIQPGDDIQTIMTKSGLNWKAEKASLYQLISGVEGEDTAVYGELKTEYLVRRNTDLQPLGIFKRPNSDSDGYYMPNDPQAILETMFEFCGVAANEIGLQFETAGSLKNGKQIWGQFIIPEEFQVAGDAHERYISMLDSFDGSTCLTGQAGMTRIVCANTFGYSLSEKAPRVKLNHSKEFTGDRKEAFVSDLKVLMAQWDEYKLAAELLARKKFSIEKAHAFYSNLLFTPKLIEVDLLNGEKGQAMSTPSTKTKNNIDTLIKALSDTINENNEPEKDCTLWTVFNGLTRYADHEMGVKKRAGKSEYQANIESVGFGAAQNLKTEGFKQLIKLAA